MCLALPRSLSEWLAGMIISDDDDEFIYHSFLPLTDGGQSGLVFSSSRAKLVEITHNDYDG
jgi:hypothetical protein